jgi:hypothetical protein
MMKIRSESSEGLVPEGLHEGSQAIYCLKFIEKDFRPVVGAWRILLRSGYTEQPRASAGLQPWVTRAGDPPCLSAVVLGRWDEGGKVAAEVRL